MKMIPRPSAKPNSVMPDESFWNKYYGILTASLRATKPEQLEDILNALARVRREGAPECEDLFPGMVLVCYSPEEFTFVLNGSRHVTPSPEEAAGQRWFFNLPFQCVMHLTKLVHMIHRVRKNWLVQGAREASILADYGKEVREAAAKQDSAFASSENTVGFPGPQIAGDLLLQRADEAVEIYADHVYGLMPAAVQNVRVSEGCESNRKLQKNMQLAADKSVDWMKSVMMTRGSELYSIVSSNIESPDWRVRLQQYANNRYKVENLVTGYKNLAH
jgi:hypothetical protein